MFLDTMPFQANWSDISIRLLLTVIAGGLIGYDRGRRGHEAGLRTTMLVALAAAVAMIQANLLLPLEGKTSSSFGVMDLMRLPLGILTGVGFIGGGAILRRGDLVSGVTTAATLWIVTVIGLSFGGGQLGLGLVATILCLLTLWVLQFVERVIPHRHKAALTISTNGDLSGLPDLDEVFGGTRYRAIFVSMERRSDRLFYCYEIAWLGSQSPGEAERIVRLVEGHFRVESFDLMARPTREE